MNNAQIIEETKNLQEGQVLILRKKETELTNIIEAVKSISESKEWQTLKILIFDELVENLERRIKTETAKEHIDTSQIYKLNGQLLWAKKYSDFNKLADVYRLELTNIKKKLNG